MTLFDKLWAIVREAQSEPTLLYIDCTSFTRTSPQAFDGLRQAGRTVRRPDLTFGTADHNVPTTDRSLPIADAIAARQIETLRKNQRVGTNYLILTQRTRNRSRYWPELGLSQLA
jgi:3-isopropylmalate/(R)-2-methylmalate dehydratase large subunit